MSLIDGIRQQEALMAGAAGAIGELVAATDLMRRGYHVFRAMSPVSPCDLLVYPAKDPSPWSLAGRGAQPCR